MPCLPVTIIIRPANFKTDIAFLKTIRETVFVEEQSVPLEMEWDQHDPQAYHLLAFADNNTPVATARLLDSGKIGRMAVLFEWRRRGIGTALLSHLIKEATERGFEQVHISAQVTAIPFYQRMGFVICSDTYSDAGIPHQDMQLRPITSK